MAFNYLFRSGSIGSLVMRNRIVMPAMATNFASAWGEPTPRLIAYYARRSLGGAGLITVENANIEDPVGGNGATQLRIDHDRF
ncbi:2,4-dienoyl-CoA reductase, partial [Candidatus Bipolaricaulota bacterium]|nr:2,4-dienoyl-CoA reductase [Candidatus Bipolaricaulota bacterium]